MNQAAPIPSPVDGPVDGLNDGAEEAVSTRIVSHPDGYYWVSEDGRQEFGPFTTLQAAEADMDRGGDVDDGALEQGESLAEAEDELGLSSWIDPETGGLAEGTATRLEDH